jgi:biotin transporter BioY
VAERAWRQRADGTLRVIAALAGTLPAAVLGAVCLARFLPTDEETRFAVGFTLAIPLWVAGICLASLSLAGWRAWLWCGGLALALGGLALGVSR